MWVKRVTLLITSNQLLITFFTHIAGGFSEVEIPSSIPNLEVKHFCADNTAGSPCGNVGRCQLLSIYLY